MASPINAALCALVATAFWSLLGYAISRHLLPRAPAVGAAPVIGWAVHSAVTLPLFELIGFSRLAVVAVAVLCAVAAGVSLRARAANGDDEAAPTIPAWAFLAAAMLALVPAVAIMPKISADAVHVADPIFDHSKIVIIEAMVRQGLPPIDPVFGTAAAPGRLVYYYLLHYSAAELALPLRVSGWEADIGVTWFTAFASLSLMMGLGVWLSKRPAAAIIVVLLAAATSLRLMLSWALSLDYDFGPFLASPTGFASWLVQAAWSPQHVMAASCVVAAMLLVVRFAERQSLLLPGVLALVVAAGFESSTYVGGITFGLSALAVAPLLLAGMAAAQRLRFVVGLAVAAALALGVAAPFVLDQFGALAARGTGAPVIVHHFEVLGDMFPHMLRRVLDLPAYWLILLPIEFPVAYVAGTLALVAMLRRAAPAPGQARRRGIGLPCRRGAFGVMAADEPCRLEQRPRAARHFAGAGDPDRGCCGRRHARSPPRPDCRRRSGRPRSHAARHREDAPLQYRRHAGPGRQCLRANAGAVAGGAPLRAADRARRQQSTIPAGPDAMAGEFKLGTAWPAQLMLCRARTGADLRAVDHGTPRGDRRAVRPGVRR